MNEHVKIRADIDTENVKGLLLINGGAAVALLTFLPHVLDKPGFETLAKAILWSLLLFQLGLIFAVAHNRFRRKCSLIYEHHNMNPPPCKSVYFTLTEPCVCHKSILFMWLSVVVFCAGGGTVFWGGFEAINQQAALKQETKLHASAPPISLNNTILKGEQPDKVAPRH